MLSLRRNRAFLVLTGTDFFETIGMSLFNIILLTHAKGFAHADLMVSLVSIGAVLPGVFGIVMGPLADRVHRKRNWLVATKFVQAALYVLLAELINDRQISVLIIIIMINLGSDVLGLFSTSLRMPIIQNKVPVVQREQAVGINQGIATLMQMVG